MHDEAYPFWQSMFDGFAEPDRDLYAADVTPLVADRMRSGWRTSCSSSESGGSPPSTPAGRASGFMWEVYPDAQFVHVIRDGRAVVNSFLHVGWWRGYEGVHRWQFGLPAAEEQALLALHGDSFVARAGIHWRRLVRSIVMASAALDQRDLPGRALSELVADPVGITLDTLTWAGLPTDRPQLERRLDAVPIFDANTGAFRIPSWRENLSPDQIAVLDDMLGDDLRRFGYHSARVARTRPRPADRADLRIGARVDQRNWTLPDRYPNPDERAPAFTPLGVMPILRHEIPANQANRFRPCSILRVRWPA